MFPSKLTSGSHVRVVAPAMSLNIISQVTQQIANARFKELGLTLSFGKHVMECDDFLSSSIESRVADLHEAFADKSVNAIFAVIGGFNSNQLLNYLDWSLIKNNPKIVCGFSDITALSNAIYAKTGLVTYSGPLYCNFGQELYTEYMVDYFKRCLMSSDLIKIEPSKQWSDDEWYKNQKNRMLLPNPGFLSIQNGEAEGTVIGANLSTLNLLQGTEFMPSLQNSILFIEDDHESKAVNFDRDLQSLMHQAEFSGVKGVVIGRFQKASEVTPSLLSQIIKTKKELVGIPVVANVDFGHSDPKITFPIGDTARLEVANASATLSILKH